MTTAPDVLWAHLSRRLPPSLRPVLGPLAECVDDPRVTDVFVTGSGEVFVETGSGASRVTGLVLSAAEATDVARNLVEAGGRHIDESTPVADVNLGHGIRVHAVLWPIASRGTEISLRIHRHQRPALEGLDLENQDAVLPALIRLVHNHQTLLVTGVTGSGKTTLLAALMAHARPTERLVVLEDVSELSIDHPHAVYLECRQNNMEGVGEVTLSRLVREALRMRPDRLIVGECRGSEFADVLQAFHTGHKGGATTIHAHSIPDVPTRLDSLGTTTGLSEKQLAVHVAQAFDAVVHVEKTPTGSRRLTFGQLVVTSEGRLGIVPTEAATLAE
jgi:pilus assembly protein CpaF